jgi:hypothetical protein
MNKLVSTHFFPVSAVRLVVLFVNRVSATNAVWSPNPASTESNEITAAGRCAPRYVQELVSNSTARRFVD